MFYDWDFNSLGIGIQSVFLHCICLIYLFTFILEHLLHPFFLNNHDQKKKNNNHDKIGQLNCTNSECLSVSSWCCFTCSFLPSSSCILQLKCKDLIRFIHFCQEYGIGGDVHFRAMWILAYEFLSHFKTFINCRHTFVPLGTKAAQFSWKGEGQPSSP